MQFFPDKFLTENKIDVNITCSEEKKLINVNLTLDHMLPYDQLKKLHQYINELKEVIANHSNVSDFTVKEIIKVLNPSKEKKEYLEYVNYLVISQNIKDLDISLVNYQQGSLFIPSTYNKEVRDVLVSFFKNNGVEVTVEYYEYNPDQLRQELRDREKATEESFKEMVSEYEKIIEENKQIKEAMKKSKASVGKMDETNISKIHDIPTNQFGIDELINNGQDLSFTIKGELISKEFVKVKNEKYWANLIISDHTDSITCKKYVDQNEKDQLDKIQEGYVAVVFGQAYFDTYVKEVVLKLSKIKVIGRGKKDIPEDNALEKRIELHLHTNMSALDGINSVEDYVKRAKLWGHEAIAFTDHDGVYSYHDVMKKCGEAGIKPIYGVELGFVDEKRINITFTEEDIDLKEATYVVFDLETTGFRAIDDQIIQIGALKLYKGQIIDSLNLFINPERHIPNKITALTSITDQMVENSETIDKALPKFIEFIGNSILVAHNANFDIYFMYEKMKQLGIFTHEYPVIDTLQFARNFYYNDLKRFGLKELAKYFKVTQEHHHLADDDTRVTAEIFMQMLQTLYRNNIYNYKDINGAINQEEAYKHIVPTHINLLVKNQVGYKNLFKIISDSLTDHYYQESRVLRGVLDKYREGILVGSGCKNGEVFEYALNKSEEDLERVMSYYDYIEVQPIDIYRDMLNKKERELEFVDDIDYEEHALIAVKRIIKIAKKLGKIVVATSDCHYIDKDEKQYRSICISTPKIGGGLHPLSLCVREPDQHFRSTSEMLGNFAFLGPDYAHEIVVTNTHKIADMIEDIVAFRTGKDALYSPADDEFKDSLGVPSIKEDLTRIVYETAHKRYGENLPKIVSDRLTKEMNSIISNGYSPVYYMAYLLVKKSNDDGYVVGSRGSVGSSLVATMMGITEVNPLTPHYYCECGFNAFKLTAQEKEMYPPTEQQLLLEEELQSVKSGYDLPERTCPCCGRKLHYDGQDIPFETFLGFKGDKTPDIDLNFSGVYQPNAHEYIRTLMGEDRAFRAGTVGTVKDNTAFGYVKKYYETRGENLRKAEIDRIGKHLIGIRRTTGQHPGGIVVVPSYKDIYDVTPIQYPADKTDNSWRTTHFEYHSFEDNLLKLDILGHDDPTTIRYLFDYVEAHPDEFPFHEVKDIPVNDPEVYKMFYETSVLGLKPDDIRSEVATFAIPEFGTVTTRGMLEETRPKNFADLVKISGLAHGTNVWATNSQELVAGRTEHGQIPFDSVIGCRDDIMVYLMSRGLDPKVAFDTMEFVRKGKAAKGDDPAKWHLFCDEMRKKNIPEWYIWSCGKIEYMFPKAHAVAYVMMAVRIAWFKLYKPLVFYSAFFSIRAEQFEPENMLNGTAPMNNRIRELQEIKNRTAKEDDLLTMYQVAVEMLKRGFKFLPVDIKHSEPLNFKIEGNCLRLPFIAVPSLGESVALDIAKQREEKPFTSKADVSKRTKLNKTLFQVFIDMKAFNDLPDESDDPEEFDFGLFDI